MPSFSLKAQMVCVYVCIWIECTKYFYVQNFQVYYDLIRNKMENEMNSKKVIFQNPGGSRVYIWYRLVCGIGWHNLKITVLWGTLFPHLDPQPGSV
jgi:hypothetical protein